MTIVRSKSGPATRPQTFFAFVILCLLIKAVLPAGFMPAQSKDGWIELVICSGMGERTISVPLEGSDKTDPQKPSQTPCAFQFVATGKSITPVFETLSVAFTTTYIAREDEDQTPPYTVFAFLFEARGPPVA